jgi:hypothetical protein
MLAHTQHHCPGPDTAVPCPTEMPPRSAAAKVKDQAMQRSTERILTTHVGSLIRPASLQEFLRAKQAGKSYDQAAYEDCLKASVAEVVRKQAEVGVDVVSDGEFGKSISWSQKVLERLSGFERRSIKPGGGQIAARPAADTRDQPCHQRRRTSRTGRGAHRAHCPPDRARKTFWREPIAALPRDRFTAASIPASCGRSLRRWYRERVSPAGNRGASVQ